MHDDDIAASGSTDALPTLFSPLDLRLPVDLLLTLVRDERARLTALPAPSAPAELELHAWRRQQLVDLLAWLHVQGETAGVSLYITETDVALSDDDFRDLLDGAGDAEPDDLLA